jgi:hypothetical protein
MSARSRRAPWFRPDPSTRYAIETGGVYGIAVAREQEAPWFVFEGFRWVEGASPDPDRPWSAEDVRAIRNAFDAAYAGDQPGTD